MPRFSRSYGPTSYEGLTDGDTFDGGDGQTGVVGDGKLNLDSFETNAVIESRTAKDQVRNPSGVTFIVVSRAGCNGFTVRATLSS